MARITAVICPGRDCGVSCGCCCVMWTFSDEPRYRLPEVDARTWTRFPERTRKSAHAQFGGSPLKPAPESSTDRLFARRTWHERLDEFVRDLPLRAFQVFRSASHE